MAAKKSTHVAESTDTTQEIEGGFDMPPATANIPPVPRGFIKKTGNLRGVKPRTPEINRMIAAVDELRRLADYDAIFGRAAPPYDVLLHSFERAAAWSAMRVSMEAWDAVCRNREELAWRDARRVMKTFKSSLALASHYDDSLTLRLPNTSGLLNAMTHIAQKGVASRKANKEAEAQGKPALRGKLAKRAQRAAAKAALAAAEAKLAAERAPKKKKG